MSEVSLDNHVSTMHTMCGFWVSTLALAVAKGNNGGLYIGWCISVVHIRRCSTGIRQQWIVAKWFVLSWPALSLSDLSMMSSGMKRAEWDGPMSKRTPGLRVYFLCSHTVSIDPFRRAHVKFYRAKALLRP